MLALCQNYAGWDQKSSTDSTRTLVSAVLLSAILINDIDSVVVNKVLKFADDTKIIGNTVTSKDVEILEQDLKSLYRLSQDWQMLFSLDKCKLM